MSYDVSIPVPGGTEWFNITSNMAAFFREFGAYPPHMHQLPKKAAQVKIEHALASISRARRGELIQFNAVNGWGDWETATMWLMRVAVACNEGDPLEKVEVSW